MKLRTYFGILFLPLFFVFGCQDPFTQDESFIKVFDDQVANRKYFPIDIVQTPDGGYLILSARDTWDVYIIKTDKGGNFVNEYFANSPYVNPVGKWLELNGQFYFVCMDRVGLFSYLMQVDPSSGAVTEVAAFGGIIYPLSAAVVEGQYILIQNYNRDSQKSAIYKIDASGQVIASNSFFIFESVEQEVVDHITRAGHRFPTFCGEVDGGGKYYFNSFYNYSFSLVFVNASDLSFSGVYNGSNYNGGVSSYASLPGKHVVSRFSFGANFFNLEAPVNTSTIGFSDDLGGTGMTELQDNAPVHSLQTTIGGKNMLFLLSETKGNKLVLFAYDLTTGELTGKKYIGNGNPFHTGNFRITADGGMVILAQTYVNASFPRNALIRLTDEELKQLAAVEME